MTDRPASGDALPAGKLPAALLRELVAALPQADDVVLGPGIGRDVAVVDLGGTWLAAKSDPITFAADRIGWYAIHVNANDLAAAGAEPRWFLASVLLPEGSADAAMARRIMDDLAGAAAGIGVTLVGGHTEITAGLRRPVVAGTMLGIVPRGRLIRPDGLVPGDVVLLTKGMAIEATSIIARELPGRLRAAGFSSQEIAAAADFLREPGISVTADSRVACAAGDVHAMHDPTEGGVATALEELAEAAGVDIEVDGAALDGAISPLARRVCEAVGVDPRGVISSGALLIGVPPASAGPVESALAAAGIGAWRIGVARPKPGDAGVGWGRPRLSGGAPWRSFSRDEIVRICET